MLSLHQLEVFIVVAESRTFVEAAEKLYISQPAVSQHIKTLESSLGTRLFDRGRRGISLTTAGETLLSYTREILRLVALAENAVTDVLNLAEGKTTIGATPNLSGYLLPEWIRSFRTRFPNLTPSVQTNITPNIIEDVLDHRLDIGIVEGEIEEPTSDRLGIVILEYVPQVVIVGKQHSWWDHISVEVHELVSEIFVMRQKNSQTRVWLDQVLQENGISPRITGEFDNPEAIKHAVISGVCVSILPEYAVKREVLSGLLHTVHIEDVDLSRSLKLIWDRDVIFSPVTRAFISQLAETYSVLREIIQDVE